MEFSFVAKDNVTYFGGTFYGYQAGGARGEVTIATNAIGGIRSGEGDRCGGGDDAHSG